MEQIDITMTSAVAGSAQGFAYEWALSDVTNHEEFLNLFEEYRIVGVKYHMRPRLGINVATQTTDFGVLHVWRDHDDVNTPTAQAEYLQKQSVKSWNMNKPPANASIYIKPSILFQTYESTTSTGYSPKFGQWISSNDPSVPHYGLKMWWEDVTQGTNSSATVHATITYYLQFRGTK